MHLTDQGAEGWRKNIRSRMKGARGREKKSSVNCGGFIQRRWRRCDWTFTKIKAKAVQKHHSQGLNSEGDRRKVREEGRGDSRIKVLLFLRGETVENDSQGVERKGKSLGEVEKKMPDS